MDQASSIAIARDLIKRYGHQAEAIAEERAAILAHQDPGLSHFWEQVPTVVGEFRRSNAARASSLPKKDA